MMKRTRGRPRKFDEQAVLSAAGNLFWQKGFSATSLDDLSEAMGMTRPSIYGAFGNKEAVYRRTLAQFIGQMEEVSHRTLFSSDDIRKALAQFFSEVLAVYTGGEEPLGCMVMSTAVCEASCHPEIKSDLLDAINTIDEKIKTRLDQAQNAGQIRAEICTEILAQLMQALVHTLSIRARAGEQQSKLKKLIESGIDMIIGD